MILVYKSKIKKYWAPNSIYSNFLTEKYPKTIFEYLFLGDVEVGEDSEDTEGVDITGEDDIKLGELCAAAVSNFSLLLVVWELGNNTVIW